MDRTLRLTLSASLAMLGGLLGSAPALGATIGVSTEADELSADGACSLREAISAANDDSAGPGGDCPQGSGADTVSIPPGSFGLSISDPPATPPDNGNVSGDLDILSTVTIAGAGAGTTTIDAKHIDRVLEVRPGRVATINDVTVTGGRAPDGPDGFDVFAANGADAHSGFGGGGAPGGGVLNAGALTVVDSTISGNTAGRGGNGGIAKGGDGATASNGGKGGDAFAGNAGNGGDGGGIFTSGSVTHTRVTVVGNAAGAGGVGGPATGGQGGGAISGTGGNGGSGLGGIEGNGGRGGGIAEAGGGTLTIDESTVSGNTAGAGGAGGLGQGGAGGLSAGSSGVGGAGGNGTGGEGENGGEGGGISADDPVVATRSLIQGNAAGAGGQGGDGRGAIGGAATGSNGTAGPGGNGSGGGGGYGGDGGGLSVGSGSVINDTITGNVGGPAVAGGTGTGGKGGNATSGQGGNGGNGTGMRGGDGGSGGGLLVSSGAPTVLHSTITSNDVGALSLGGIGVAGAGGNGSPAGSGGTATPGSPGVVGTAGAALTELTAMTLTNTIVSGNAAPSCEGPLVDGGHDIAFPDATCSGANVDPKLASLADNGGPTRTQALGSGSLALDAVPASGAGCVANDQRAVSRPNGTGCDIGAYEHAPPGVLTGDAEAVTSGSATLDGQLNPNARSTSYHFELGTTTAYGSSTPSQTTAAGVSPVAVAAGVTGLAPATTYHYRLVASNADGSTTGNDRTFTTLSPAAGGGLPLAFGPRTLVTLKLAARRIPARGPLKVLVSNANGFPISGKLSGQTISRVSVSRKRRIKLKAKAFNVSTHARTTVKLRLPKALRRLLEREHRLALRLTARVKDPAGHTRTVEKKVFPRLKASRRR